MLINVIILPWESENQGCPTFNGTIMRHVNCWRDLIVSLGDWLHPGPHMGLITIHKARHVLIHGWLLATNLPRRMFSAHDNCHPLVYLWKFIFHTPSAVYRASALLTAWTHVRRGGYLTHKNQEPSIFSGSIKLNDWDPVWSTPTKTYPTTKWLG